MSFNHRHLLSIEDLSKRDVERILSTARSLKEISFRPIKKVPALRGKTIINCFFENSTRTRTSFELAAKRLSADTLNFSSSGSAMSKGESILDTILNLNAMQPDMIIIRHASSGMPARLAEKLPHCSVINAGDGLHEHPTQALLDLMTMEESIGSVRGRTIAIIGDIMHSRVARSNILLLVKMGANVVVAGPRTLIPVGIEDMGVTVLRSVADAVNAADVVMCLRIQKERLGSFSFPSLREYARYYGVSPKLFLEIKRDILIMHPGPVNRGVEISPEVADGPHSVILDQVENGIAVRMACLYLLGGLHHEEVKS